MGILTKEVEIKPSGKSIQYYRDLGYDAKWHEPLVINIEDLAKGSKAPIKVLCDMCEHNVMEVPYEVYNRVVKETGSYVCRDCSYEKSHQTNEKRYGVPVVSQSEEFKEKIKQTNLERYGVDNYGKTKECHEKIKQTCLDKYQVEHFAKSQEIKDKKVKTSLERYGVENVLQVKEVRDKIINTNLERYGVEHPSSLPEVQEKIRQTNLERYGAEYNLQIPEVREKIAKTLHENGTTPTSKQQRYIFNLYKSVNSETELNYPISYYLADICFPEEKIELEYDGGFHNGRVKTGQLTQEEFNQKEIIRSNVIKREGYKQIRIISSNDKLPSDSILLQMLSEARNYFSEYPNHSWIEFNLDTSLVCNAENKQGIPYDFGTLRRIKDEDLQQQTTMKGA